MALLYRKFQLIIREGLTELESLCLASKDIPADSAGVVSPWALGKCLEKPEVRRVKGSAPGHLLVIKGRRFWAEDRCGATVSPVLRLGSGSTPRLYLPMQWGEQWARV